MGAYERLSAENRGKVDSLLAETRASGGLAPVDVERFWADQESAKADPFGKDIPQPPLGAVCNWECAFDELGIEQDWQRYENDPDWAVGLNIRYNDISEKIVGRRLLSETRPDPSLRWPKVKGLHDVFEGRYVWEGGKAGSWWLMQAAKTPDELRALLDRVDARDIRSTILPENWQAEKARLTALGAKPPLYRHQRGPCTFACSIYGAENMIFLCLDEPDLAERFSRTVLRVMLDIARVQDEEAGYTSRSAPHGFSFADDNCCLFNREMYELFGLPVLRGMFDRYSPNAADRRFQHSDSAMGHLLPLLSRVDLTGTNFGPTLTVAEIRRHLGRAVIDGQLAPFTFCRNEEANMVAEFLRDFDQARESRGLCFATAGSINNGSRLTGMRLLMAAIQRYGRY
jgi:uroporphyrinogen decarboxylase